MNTVIHFEIQVDDIERAKRFYEKALGWNIMQAMKKEEGGMDYWLIETRKSGPGINGGMYVRPANTQEQFYTYDCTIAVDNIDQAIAAVQENGGTITREKEHMTGVGWFAGAKDTEGNRFALMEPTNWQPT